MALSAFMVQPVFSRKNPSIYPFIFNILDKWTAKDELGNLMEKKYTYPITITRADQYWICYRAHFKALPEDKQQLVRAKDPKAMEELGAAVAAYIDQHPDKFDKDVTTTCTSAFPLKGEDKQ